MMVSGSETSSCLKGATVAIVSLAVSLAAGAVRAQVRPEIHPIQTMTLSTQQVLLGVQGGKPTVIGGELRSPARAGCRVRYRSSRRTPRGSRCSRAPAPIR